VSAPGGPSGRSRPDTPGATRGWNDPPLIDLPALAFARPVTPPVAPEGSAGGAALPVTDPPVARHAVSDCGAACSAPPVARPRVIRLRWLRPHPRCVRLPARPVWRLLRRSLLTGPLPLPPSGLVLRFARCDPRSADRSTFPLPRALPGTKIIQLLVKPQVKHSFQIPRVIPEVSRSSPGNAVSSTRRPPVTHSCVHSSGTRIAAVVVTRAQRPGT
jgi:hypothetical protein